MYSVSTPAYLVEGTRSLWIELRRDVDHSSLYSIGFEFLVNVTALCPCRWTIDYIWFRNLTFSSMEQLRQDYDHNQTIREHLLRSRQLFALVPAALSNNLAR